MTPEDIISNLGFEKELIQEILLYGRIKHLAKGGIIIHADKSANEIPFVVSGSLAVMREDEHQNQLFLYYLEGGDTCAMSITCCIEQRRTGIIVQAEEDAVLWMIPSGYLEDWVKKYTNFRHFVFHSYQIRFEELLTAIDSIAFMNMDQRLYKYLLDKKQASGDFVINKTHEQIARDLNTSRVVISRLLKKMEKDEKIEQQRNRIEIL